MSEGGRFLSVRPVMVSWLGLLMPVWLAVAGCGGPTDGGQDDDDETTTPAGDDDSGDDDTGGDDDSGDDDSGGDDDGGGPVGTPWEDVPTSSFYVAGSFPQDGAWAVPQELLVQFFFSEPYFGEVSDIHATLTGTFTGASVALTDGVFSGDQASIGFPVALWPEDRTYVLHLEIDESPFVDAAWPLEYEATFKTSYSGCGQTFDMLAGLEFETVGANQTTANLLNVLLGEADTELTTGMILQGLSQNVDFPVEGFEAGIAGLVPDATESGAYTLNYSLGVSSQIQGCSISAGGDLEGSADQAVIPIQITSGSTTYMYLYRFEMTGTVQASGNVSSLDDLWMTGAMLGPDLVNLLTAFGLTPSEGEDGEEGDSGALELEFDLDTDGDGFGDAATVTVTSQPTAVVLTDCAP